MTLGEKIQLLRKEKNLSQEELAAKLEVSRQAISKWELGDSVPDIDKIITISDFFAVTTDYLLKESTERNIVLKEDNVATRILYIACPFFAIIGLLSACGNWEKTQNAENIAGGMIIQLVGIAALFIGKALAPKEKVLAPLAYASLATLLFMPISLVMCLVTGATSAPYPTDIYSAIFFIPAYVVALIAGVVALKSRAKRLKLSGNNS